MSFNSSCLLALLAAFASLLGQASAQSFQIAPAQVNVVVAPGFNHADVRVPITGTAAGYNFGALHVSSNTAWVAPSIDKATHELVLAFSTSTLTASRNTASISVDDSGTSVAVAVGASVAPLNVTKLVDDPRRSRTYGIQQDGVNAGAVFAIEPLTNTHLSCLTVGKQPANLAVSTDGRELLVINAVDPSITAIDLATFTIKETIPLVTFGNSGTAGARANVAYGEGNIIYYTDASLGPTLRVFDRVTRQVVQSVMDGLYGFGGFALTPDGKTLYAWAMSAWSGDNASSYVVKYTVGADGKLTLAGRTPQGGPVLLSRDPTDSPVLIDNTGRNIFIKQCEVDPANISLLRPLTGSATPICAITPGGEVASTPWTVFKVSADEGFYNFPVAATTQAFTSDYARLVYFNPTLRTIETVDLTTAADARTLGHELSPADGSGTLSPAVLRWPATPGVDDYRIYLGQSEAAAKNAGPGSAEDLGEVYVPSLALDAPLVPGMKYFWRIDAIDGGVTTKGQVYSFTVSPISCDVSAINVSTVLGQEFYQVALHLTSAASGVAYTVTVSEDAGWISLRALGGQTPSTFTLGLNSKYLYADTYTATLTVKQTSNGQTLFTIPITFQVDLLAITAMESDRTSANIYALSEVIQPSGGSTRAYLLELDSASRSIKRVVQVGASATDLAVHSGDGLIYVTNWKIGSLLAIDLATFKVVRTYPFTPFGGMGYPSGDAYRVAAGGPGRVLVEPEDQWINLELFDTAAGKVLKTNSVREGGGEFAAGGRYYYHGEEGGSGAVIHKYDLTGDVFAELAHTSVTGNGILGSRKVVVTEDGEKVFWNGAMLDKNLASPWLIGDDIISASPDGRLAFSSTKIYDTTEQKAIYTLPAKAGVSAYNATSRRLAVQSGQAVVFYDIDGAVPLPAPMLFGDGPTAQDTSMDLYWSSMAINTGFTLQMRVTGQTAWVDVNNAIPQSASKYTVTGLAPLTSYDFQLRADGRSASSDWSNTVSVTTKAGLVITPVTGAAAEIGSRSALLQGSSSYTGALPFTGFSLSAVFQLGLTAQYDQSFYISQFGVSGSFSVRAESLLPGATYHYRLAVASSKGTVYGADATFTTLAEAPSARLDPPVVYSDLARLLASINPSGAATTVHFDYGLTAALGSSTPSMSLGSGPAALEVSVPIQGLTPQTVYYYRLVASNQVGNFMTGVSSFSTPSGPVVVLKAADDFGYTVRGKSCVIPVLANDVITPAAPLSLRGVGTASAGSAVLNSDGTITYTAGAKFTGVDSFIYAIGDGLGRTAIGTVVVRDTYASSLGLYYGLVGDSASEFANTGTLSLQISKTGAMTGKLTLGGVAYAVKSSLQPNGSASFSIKQTAKTNLLVSFQIDPTAQRLTGTVTTAGGALPVSAVRSSFTAKSPAPQAGRYSLLLPPPAGATAQGYGFATMTVSATGLVSVIGRTGAAVAFTAAAYIGADARFPFYSVTKSPKSTGLHGWVQFRNVAATSDCDGAIGWNDVTLGQALPLSLIGSRYIAPAKGSRVLPFAPSTANAEFTFGHGSATLTAAPISATLTATKLISSTAQVSKLALNTANGLFSGTLNLAGKAAPFYGIAFQRQTLGAGVVLTAAGPGWVELAAPGSSLVPPAGGTVTGGTPTLGGGTTTVTGGTLTLTGGGSPVITGGGGGAVIVLR